MKHPWVCLACYEVESWRQETDTFINTPISPVDHTRRISRDCMIKLAMMRIPMLYIAKLYMLHILFFGLVYYVLNSISKDHTTSLLIQTSRKSDFKWMWIITYNILETTHTLQDKWGVGVGGTSLSTAWKIMSKINKSRIASYFGTERKPIFLL